MQPMVRLKIMWTASHQFKHLNGIAFTETTGMSLGLFSQEVSFNAVLCNSLQKIHIEGYLKIKAWVQDFYK